MKKKFISWDEEQSLVVDIIQQIHQSNWKPDYIVGLTRGGLLPAVMMSHWFDVPMNALDVSMSQPEQCVTNCGMSEDAFNGKNILIVDDINDSGATLNWIMDDWQTSCMPDSPKWKDIWNGNVQFAVVVNNAASKCNAEMDFVGLDIDKSEENIWIEFPYEDWWKIKE